jgi:hypothetical protein
MTVAGQTVHPRLGLFAPFARALEVPARASSEDPLAKSLRRHAHTKLMTVNLLRMPSLATMVRIYPPSPYRVFGDEA